MAKKFLPVVAVLILIALLVSAFPPQPAEASPGWWDPYWQYKMKLTIAASDVYSDLANFAVLVHLLYSGQSARLFKLQPGMVWPDGSWVFSRILGDEPTGILASILCTLITAGFVAGGVGIFVSQAWWRPVVVASAAFSAGIFILLWDGKLQMLSNNGVFGLLINIAILVALLVFRWPRFGF